MNTCLKFLSTSLLALLASAAFAQTPTAPGFSVLANAAVTCTAGTGGGITGNVGTFLAAPTGAITETPAGCITGTKVLGATAAFDAFLDSYAALKTVPCTRSLTGSLDGVTLTNPGVYCVDAVAKAGTLTLAGPANGVWIFKVAAVPATIPATGALTGTNFNVVLNGPSACNVTWWVAQAATMTDSNFNGNILAGAAITMDRGTLNGDAYAKADVTFTGTLVTGCGGSGQLSDGGGLVCKVKKHKHHKNKHHGGKDDDDDDDGDDDDGGNDDDGKNWKKGNHPFRN